MKTTLPQPLWTALVLLLLSAGCGRDTPKPYPDVTAVTPEVASPGATVTLTGTGFSPEPAKNVVTFSSSPDPAAAIVGTVEQATSTELIVRVPLTAFAAGLVAVVSVATEGRSGGARVTLKSDLYPEAFSITPQPARAGEVVTITGRNLNPDPKQTAVLFFPPEGEPVAQGYNPRVFPTFSTGTTLQVQVPTGAKSGEVWVVHYLKPDESFHISQILPITIAP